MLTWIGQPVWWLRAAARGFVSGSVAANAAAGWPDPIAVFLHCFPPVIVLLVTEAGRTALLRKHALAGGRDPIPMARWLAAPAATLVMWRRMALWGVKSYAMAVTAEVTRRQAIMQLQQHYGARWRQTAPGDLVWLLRTGNRLEEACARVAAITASEDADGTGGNRGTGTGRAGTGIRGWGTGLWAGTGKRAGTRNRGRGTGLRSGTGKRAGTGNRRPGTGSRAGTGKHSGTGSKNGNRRSVREPGTGAGRPGNPASGNRTPDGPDPVLLAEVRRRIAEHRDEHGRDITVAELAIALGRRKAVAGELLRAARAPQAPDHPSAEARS